MRGAHGRGAKGLAVAIRDLDFSPAHSDKACARVAGGHAHCLTCGAPPGLLTSICSSKIHGLSICYIYIYIYISIYLS